MKKIAIGLIAILILVVFASGCTSNKYNSTGNSKGQNNSNMQSNSNMIVQINSDISWSGTLTYNNKTQTIQGNGNAIYDLGQNPGAITITLHKTDNNNGILTLQLLKGKDITISQSTTANQGVVSLNYASNSF